MDLIEEFSKEKVLFILHVMIGILFFTSDAVKYYNLWSSQKVCEALTFLLYNMYIRFGSKLYRQIVGIHIGTYCAPLVAYLFCSVMRETSCCLFQMITNLI